MGVLPCSSEEQNADSWPDREETWTSAASPLNSGVTGVTVTATAPDGRETRFEAVVRIETPGERNYYLHGGIMQYVLRNLKNS